MPSPATLVQWIKRGLDIPSQAAEALAERVVPSLAIGDVSKWWQNDSRVIRPAAGWYTKAAVAGNYSHIACVNPSTSGVHVVVDRIAITNFTGGPLEYEFVSTSEACVQALTGAAQGTTLVGYRDTRGIDGDLCPASIAARTVGQMWAGHAAGQVDGHRFFRVGVSSPYEGNPIWPFQHLLVPGTALCVVNTTVNSAITIANFVWEEHRIAR